MLSSKSRNQLNYIVFLGCVTQTPFHVDYSWRIETVKSVNILGLNISSDLKWNVHVSELVRKASPRLYFLRQLKKSQVATSTLHHMHSLYSGVRQPTFSSRSTKLSVRRPRKTEKTRYEDYLPRAIIC